MPRSPKIIITRPAILLMASALMSCAQPNTPSEPPLSRDLAGRIAGAPQTCITTDPSIGLSALDPSTFVYRYGSIIYVNHPRAPCTGVAPFNTLIFERQAGRSCRGDRIRVLELGAGIPGPVCILGDWIAYRKP